MCGTVLCGYGGVSLCCVWDSLGYLCVSEFSLCVREFGVGLEMSVCCVWERLVRVRGSDCVLSVGKLGAGLGN